MALYEYHALHAIRMLERVAVRRNVKLAMVNARHTRRSRQPEVEVTADLGLKLAPTSYNLLSSVLSLAANFNEPKQECCSGPRWLTYMCVLYVLDAVGCTAPCATAAFVAEIPQFCVNMIISSLYNATILLQRILLLQRLYYTFMYSSPSVVTFVVYRYIIHRCSVNTSSCMVYVGST